MKCPECKEGNVFWWHFYSHYGKEGAWRCTECGTIFKAFIDKASVIPKLGEKI